MQIKPKVSIIIPCYNQGEYILDTIQSIQNQSYQNFEIIIVNDGSNDKKTIRLLNSFKDDKATIIYTKNCGPSAARNTGIINSKGEYILPLDADDKIAPTYLEKAVQVLNKKNDVKIVTGIVEYFGKKKGIYNLPNFDMEILKYDNIIVSCSLFRRKDYDRTLGYNTNMIYGFEDWDFWLSLLEKGGTVYKIEQVMIYYRIKKRSRSTEFNIKKHLYLRNRIYENHKELYSNNFINPQNSFEFKKVYNSNEYKLGVFILKPFKILLKTIKQLI